MCLNLTEAGGWHRPNGYGSAGGAGSASSSTAAWIDQTRSRKSISVWTSMDKKANNQHQSTYHKKPYMKQIRKKKTNNMTTCNCYILLYTVFVWTSMDKKTNNQHQSTYQKNNTWSKSEKKNKNMTTCNCYILLYTVFVWTSMDKKTNKQHQSTYQ